MMSTGRAGRQVRWVVEFVGTLRRAAVSAMGHDVLTLAQATAYSGIVALFPALIVAAAVVGLMPETQPLKVQMAAFFDRLLPSNVTPVLDAYFTTSQRNAQTVRALAGSAAVALTGAASVMVQLMEGFRRAHGLPVVKKSFWPRRLRALVLVPLSLLPMALASGFVVFGNLITHWVVGEMTPMLRAPVYVLAFVLRWTVALAGSTGIIAVIYHLGTDLNVHVREEIEPMLRAPWSVLRRDWSWRASLPGAAVATGAWFVTTLLFGTYVTRFANYSQVYGPLGAAVALLFWLYIIALSVLLGAEFNAQRGVRERKRRSAAVAAACVIPAAVVPDEAADR